VGKGQAINLQAHGDGGRQGSDDEGGGHDEPRNDAEVEAAEQVEDKDRSASKEYLAHNGEPRKVGNVKSKLDGQEQRIEKCRGAQIIYEFHFRALCIEHKK
jgi:hypothetical protein